MNFIFKLLGIKKPINLPEAGVLFFLSLFYFKNIYYLFFISKGISVFIGSDWLDTYLFICFSLFATAIATIPFLAIFGSIFIDLIGTVTMISGLGLPGYMAAAPLTLYLIPIIVSILIKR